MPLRITLFANVQWCTAPDLVIVASQTLREQRSLIGKGCNQSHDHYLTAVNQQRGKLAGAANILPSLGFAKTKVRVQSAAQSITVKNGALHTKLE
ncbi:hypothetical protein FB481_106361 [Pseudomonas sp. AG1028]|nr:hypothetical protein FB481_106361 [Pseudomonas sp. AG1028]